MIPQYTVVSIHYTADPDYLRFVWSDGLEQNRPADWVGFFRGVEAGRHADGSEYERLAFGQPNLAAQWVADGLGVIEPYFPPAPEPETEE